VHDGLELSFTAFLQSKYLYGTSEALCLQSFTGSMLLGQKLSSSASTERKGKLCPQFIQIPEAMFKLDHSMIAQLIYQTRNIPW
jgi:hypothetical protein